jgi:hypothetical protein
MTTTAEYLVAAGTVLVFVGFLIWKIKSRKKPSGADPSIPRDGGGDNGGGGEISPRNVSKD